MKNLGMIIVIAIILYGVSIFYDDIAIPPDYTDFKTDQDSLNEPNEKLKVPKEGVQQFLQMNQDELVTKIGEPDRIDPTAYGYQWWVYGQNAEQYMQVGLDKGRVVSVFVIGKELDINPLHIGQKRSEIQKEINLNNQATIEVEGTEYQFKLTEEEMQTRPLVRINGMWAQLYMDKFKDTLVGVRYMTPEILVMHRPYSLEYRGELIKQPELSNEQWQKVQEAEELQIFTLTNVIREKYNVSPLQWHEETSQVAFGHSKEMNEENYFSHVSPKQGELSDRLERKDIKYTQAGENIAANYIDSIEAVIGWLNSEGHRKAMLSEEFTHIGVGVFKKHYTQNFIVPW